MIVVSDTSPILSLAAIGHLGLLHQLYGEVCIPQAVYHEIAVVGARQPGSVEFEASDWIRTLQVYDRALVFSLGLEIDAGEAEAVALAVQLSAGLLLMDERRGRKVASRQGLRCIGVLGVLVEAKHAGLISAVKPIVDDLITKSGFWISRELHNRVLEAVGE